MSFLLVDAGNTRIKWALAADGMLARTGVVAHAGSQWLDELRAQWRVLDAPRSAWIAVVAAQPVVAALRTAITASFPDAGVNEVASGPELAGVRSGYEQPARLGVDRLLALAGAQAAGLAPALVVGVGTAVTIDALEPGRHLGGLILPSPGAMQAAVVAGTQVRPVHDGRIEPFARSTEDALASGAWIALAATVERSATTLANRLAAEPAVVLHGGGAAALQRVLERPSLLRELLVLEGLAAVARTSLG